MHGQLGVQGRLSRARLPTGCLRRRLFLSLSDVLVQQGRQLARLALEQGRGLVQQEAEASD